MKIARTIALLALTGIMTASVMFPAPAQAQRWGHPGMGWGRPGMRRVWRNGRWVYVSTHPRHGRWVWRNGRRVWIR